MKKSNAARLIFWVAIIIATGFLVRAESGEKRARMPSRQNAPPLHIFDQNGRPAVSGVPSGGQTFDVAVGQGGFTFDPDELNISVGDTVRWTWFGSGHSVTSGDPCTPDEQFCSPDNMNCDQGILSNTGTVYEFTFTQAGTYSYFCFAHCGLGMTGTINVSGGGGCSWSAGPSMPSVGARMAGVFFPANGKFYAMGGRSADVGGSEFTHPFEYDPGSNSWTIKSATYPDTVVNNMACGVLNEGGTDYIYCVGGSEVATQTTTGRVFRYDPITDTISTVPANWPSGDANILPGGFSVYNNNMYILGGFNVNVSMDDNIWQFDPVALTWTNKTAHLPTQLGYIPQATIGNLIYTGGGSTYDGLVHDSTISLVYDPVADTIGNIAAIPRATGETRGLNFCNTMYVMGGGREAPNPSNEVDIYDPVANSWSVGTPFVEARRNFPTDTDGSNNIWLAGGYGTDGVTLLDSMEIFNCPVSPCGSASPTPTPTATATGTGTPTATPTATATTTGTATATPTATATATPCEGRCTPTPRPRPTPAPRPTP